MENINIERVNCEFSNDKWKVLNATTIKLMAVVLMFLDHIHQMFATAGAPIWLTMIGRPVFPLFLFIASESFFYTRNKKKYLQRLLFASLGMTIFTFVLQRIIPNENVVLMNNAFSTFFVTALYMQSWDWFMDGMQKKAPKQIMKAILCCFIPILCALPIYLIGVLSFYENIPNFIVQILAFFSLLIPNILTVEGGYLLVVLGTLFYIVRKYRFIQIIILLALSMLVYRSGNNIQWLMCLAAIPMALYNGKCGYGIKKFFYIFYPVHIGFFYIISSFVL